VTARHIDLPEKHQSFVREGALGCGAVAQGSGHEPPRLQNRDIGNNNKEQDFSQGTPLPSMMVTRNFGSEKSNAQIYLHK